MTKYNLYDFTKTATQLGFSMASHYVTPYENTHDTFNAYAHPDGILLTFLGIDEMVVAAKILYQVRLNKSEFSQLSSGAHYGYAKGDLIVGNDQIDEDDMCDDLRATFLRAQSRGEIIRPIYANALGIKGHLSCHEDLSILLDHSQISLSCANFEKRIQLLQTLHDTRMHTTPQWYQDMFTTIDNGIVHTPRIITKTPV